ncbi:activator of 90 kDa heat shock protein ATPase homolog 1-like isoform X2 [Leuresthes tenuis]|uniref:activator of 90 kDa heat shock protein ATPase homolog 1-like isoform X2 n=1 Tax=Leuresthes tenuis TaxID=355514 RepID=UPI003B503AA8
MAKWGEGDPRWIVEERADATNVNNWHWTERDVSAWSSERLRQLLLGVRVEGPEGVCHLTDVSKLDGEASINNRKGKLFFFYEWQLRANWLGTSSSGVKFRGTVDVTNLSDENDEDDLDISLSLCKDQPSTALLDLMKRTGVKEVRRVLGEYVHELKSEFSQGMIFPTADGQKSSTPAPPKKNQVKTSKTQLVQIFTRSPATVDGRRGGRFQLLGGSISGEFTQLVPGQKIEMRWHFRSWPGEHYATVSLDLQGRGDETELRMECQGVPKGEEDSTREGWTRFYFQAIKQTFGY